MIKKWSARDSANDPESQLKALHSKLGFSMLSVLQQMPTYSEADLHLISREEDVEVWTARDFKAWELQLGADCTEFKDAHKMCCVHVFLILMAHMHFSFICICVYPLGAPMKPRWICLVDMLF